MTSPRLLRDAHGGFCGWLQSISPAWLNMTASPHCCLPYLHPCAREDRASFRKRARISGAKISFRKNRHREAEHCVALLMKRERRSSNISEGSKEQFRDCLLDCQQGQLFPHKSVVYLRVSAFLTHSPSGFPHSSYKNKRALFGAVPSAGHSRNGMLTQPVTHYMGKGMVQLSCQIPQNNFNAYKMICKL